MFPFHSALRKPLTSWHQTLKQELPASGPFKTLLPIYWFLGRHWSQRVPFKGWETCKALTRLDIQRNIRSKIQWSRRNNIIKVYKKKELHWESCVVHSVVQGRKLAKLCCTTLLFHAFPLSILPETQSGTQLAICSLTPLGRRWRASAERPEIHGHRW